MRSLGFLLSPWGIILQAVALIHFIRRRPDTYWLWIIIFLGPLGALIYIFVEVLPDAGLLRQSFATFPRRSRIRQLEAVVLDNPAAGNYEELGDLYLDDGDFLRARECYDKAIGSRGCSFDAFYRRGIAEVQLGDFPAAVVDLEYVVSTERKYDSHRAAGTSGPTPHANTGEPAKAEALFEEVTRNIDALGNLLQLRELPGRAAPYLRARERSQKILAKKPTMPGYLRRRERPWFRKANGLLKRLAHSPLK